MCVCVCVEGGGGGRGGIKEDLALTGIGSTSLTKTKE